ncbi:Peptidase family M3 [Aquisphaera giovannonii]|uniref:Peptidase family M3 n=1 Tax=Aquisphaera giovannonii TaxID=406548 RepID=A0A5B9WB63_9BACT|nr:M3 family oligoendopeptidase [Aquisphaera giovannonii]QEH37499.1 Peptidase family M3 [Aquisphaera giovannonii]
MTTSTYTPEAFPPTWLPAGTELKTWDQIEPWYRKLLAMPIESVADLERWMAAADELNAAVGEEGSRRYVAMTCQTDDPAREEAYLAFVRDIEPNLKPLLNEARNRYLDSPFRAQLPAGRHEVFDRAEENRRALFREANIPRETRLAELGQQYQKAIGAMTVQYDGQERTLAQMSPYLEQTDRAVRQETWELCAARRLKDKDALDDLFDQMLALRGEVAREAGFDSYVDYAYRDRDRFDYGPADAARFQDAVERVVVPLARKIQEGQRDSLKLDRLRPWDTAVDSLGRPPLKPFEDVSRLAEGTEQIFREIDPELGAQFGFMRAKGLLDLANRKGKAPGGYQTTFEVERVPFIFMNAVGLDGDVRTLLHEGGHAFHTLAARGEPLAAYRGAPLEFCEVASMTMELFGAKHLHPFYGPAEADRSNRKLLEGIVLILPWIATVDAFQHWLYGHPGHTRDERKAAWRGLIERFGGIVDWTGYEDARDHSWHRQLHIFLYPFYYIEYGIAQLGALQLWHRSLTDPAGAVAAYKRALAIGGARKLPDLFAAADARFGFDEATISPLMSAIGDELGRLAP